MVGGFFVEVRNSDLLRIVHSGDVASRRVSHLQYVYRTMEHAEIPWQRN